MNQTTNKSVSDADLKNNILSELKFDPSVKATDIGVVVKDGTVTLNGSVTSYWEKSSAVRAAKRVVGVSAIADEIQIKFPGSIHRTDGDIAAAAAEHIKWSTSVPENAVTVTVRDGMVTLEGTLEWWFQKNAAENAVHYLQGVKSVFNKIVLKPTVTSSGIESAIEAAFKRSAVLDADEVTVSTAGGTVTLRGKVRTYSEKEEAARTAWAAAGVQSVDNQLTVNWSWLGA